MAEDDEAAFEITDKANALRLLRSFGSDLMWVSGLGWYVWDGSLWKRSEDEALRIASRLGRVVRAEAALVTERGPRALYDPQRPIHRTSRPEPRGPRRPDLEEPSERVG